MKYFMLIVCSLVLAASLGCGIFSRDSGLVEVGSVYGFVVTEEGEPINLAQVMIAGDFEAAVYTNNAGYYILSDLTPGKYNLLVTRVGYEAQNVSVSVSAGKKTEKNILMGRPKMKEGMIFGTVVDYNSNEPLVCEITVTELGMTTASDSSGHFTFENLDPKTYLLKIEALNYITSHTDVTVQSTRTAEPMVRMIKAGMVITLEGIEFEFGKATIKPESYPILDDAAAILTNHPEIEVEVQGHTDNVGADEFNLKLSQKRAESVREYLIDMHMIEPVRLIPLGYGETVPVADNDTEAGRAKNRRVDFLILE
jgi:outer membrane protein OmpA-like peptidoglycan-associated protein